MSTGRITIVDYGAGNLGSVANMLKKVGGPHIVTAGPRDLESADKIILPGVGAFDAAVNALKERGYWEPLNHKVLKEKTPVLGICLGMQLLMEGSDEGGLPGFGWIEGRAKKFAPAVPGEKLRVPHMGWNEIEIVRPAPLVDGLGQGARFYFVHSFAVDAADREAVIAQATHGRRFDAIIGKDNVLGAQFHPEKSHRFGMRLLRNFVERY